MKQEGRSLETISKEVEVALEVLKQFLPQDSQETDVSEANTQFIYMIDRALLRRTNLLTGEQSCHVVPDYEFPRYCSWSELPGGSLVITGGYDDSFSVMGVEKVDVSREWAVSSLSPMHSARCDHASVLHFQYLYVLGGFDHKNLDLCERYVCAENRWEVLPALPVACYAMSAVVLSNSLFAFGGVVDQRDLDTVQMLSLDSLTWELLLLKLPEQCNSPPCFKIGTEVYLVISDTLYSFTPNEIKPIKTLTEGIESRQSSQVLCLRTRSCHRVEIMSKKMLHSRKAGVIAVLN
jgi:hypothetical protein